MTAPTAKRVVILGAGMIAAVHRRAALLAGAQVVGVMASSPGRSRQVAADWGVEQAYENVDQVAASDVDVDTEDSALIMFRTANDVAGSAVISQLSAGRKNRLWVEVDGMRQSAVFDHELPEQLWLGSDLGGQILVRDPNHGSAEQRRLSMLPAGHPQGFAQCFENYVRDSYAAIDALLDGGEPPAGLPTFADGARAAAICDTMLPSAESHQWVSTN